MRAFKLKEHPLFKRRYTIEFVAEPPKSCFPKGITGSTNVLIARFLGLSYPEYLTLARDVFKADLVGKGTVYITPVFPRSKEVVRLVELLNIYMKRIKSEHDYPIEAITDENGEEVWTNIILE